MSNQKIEKVHKCCLLALERITIVFRIKWFFFTLYIWNGGVGILFYVDFTLLFMLMKRFIKNLIFISDSQW